LLINACRVSFVLTCSMFFEIMHHDIYGMCTVKHHAWLDKKRNLLWIRFIGFCGLAELGKLLDDCDGLVDGKDTQEAAIDISGIESFPDEEIRSELAKRLSVLDIKRVVVVSGRPQIKVVAAVLVKDLSDYTHARSFSRKEQALNWLKHAEASAKLSRENLQPEIA